jgi:hypothetical protein
MKLQAIKEATKLDVSCIATLYLEVYQSFISPK